MGDRENIQINISEFFKTDLPSYAAYDNCRKIASYVDGLKISMRKILYTLLKKYPNEKIKTETAANMVAGYTNFLHGAANLCGVCNTLAQSFVGANNYPLLNGIGGFGTRINPTCSAPRYTRIELNNIINKLFNLNDEKIIGRQFFEGDYIEPQYFIPIFPIIFLNGSHGLSTGFSQDIYPRNPKEIIKYILGYLNNKKTKVSLLPWFKGHIGKIEYNSEINKIESFGVVEKNNSTTYTITELPIEMEYQKYIEILDKLCDNNIIQTYIDKCDPKTDKILFIIKTTRDFTKKNENERDLYKNLYLIKSLSEQYNCIDENNRIKEFNSVEEILNAFIDIRLKFYQKRKDYMLNTFKTDLNILASKLYFITGVVKKEIQINNIKKEDIIKQLESNEKIIKIDNSYEYLLKMSILKLTKEEVILLKENIKKLKEQYVELKNKTIESLWIEDLQELQKIL